MMQVDFLIWYNTGLDKINNIKLNKVDNDVQRIYPCANRYIHWLARDM